MVLRHYHLTIDQWEELPWWQQRVYIEGLQKEAKQAQKTPKVAGGRRDRPAGQKLRQTSLWKQRHGAKTAPAAALPPGSARLAARGFDTD